MTCSERGGNICNVKFLQSVIQLHVAHNPYNHATCQASIYRLNVQLQHKASPVLYSDAAWESSDVNASWGQARSTTQ